MVPWTTHSSSFTPSSSLPLSLILPPTFPFNNLLSLLLRLSPIHTNK